MVSDASANRKGCSYSRTLGPGHDSDRLELFGVEVVEPDRGAVVPRTLDDITVGVAWGMQDIYKGTHVTERGWALVQLPAVVAPGFAKELCDSNELAFDYVSAHPGAPSVSRLQRSAERDRRARSVAAPRWPAFSGERQKRSEAPDKPVCFNASASASREASGVEHLAEDA